MFYKLILVPKFETTKYDILVKVNVSNIKYLNLKNVAKVVNVYLPIDKEIKISVYIYEKQGNIFNKLKYKTTIKSNDYKAQLYIEYDKENIYEVIY